MQHNKTKRCLKCSKVIHDIELHKIVMYVVDKKFTEHHYEHVECPEKFTEHHYEHIECPAKFTV